jgi:hypothetical protein
MGRRLPCHVCGAPIVWECDCNWLHSKCANGHEEYTCLAHWKPWPGAPQHGVNICKCQCQPPRKREYSPAPRRTRRGKKVIDYKGY